jgi:hypothetical protein
MDLEKDRQSLHLEYLFNFFNFYNQIVLFISLSHQILIIKFQNPN